MLIQPKLLALSGPLRGKLFEFGEDDLSIGRGAEATITIDHKSVSRRHCVFRRSGASYKVQDENSRNGTFVNGDRVEERMLNHGDRVMTGNSTFVFLTRDEDVSSLLSDVRLTDEAFDSGASIELRREETVYLHPEQALAGTTDARRLQDFAALLQLGAALKSSQSLTELEDQALELIMRGIPAETGAILLTGSKPDQILSLYGRNRDGSESVTVSRSVVSHVLDTRRALLTNDAPGSIRDNQTLIRAAARSLICVPLVAVDQVFGVIYLASGEELPPFDESHLQLLTAMAAMLALPLESVRKLDLIGKENIRLQTDFDSDHRLIGDSPAMKQVYKFIVRAGPTDSTVLIRGESGTGKELIARALHRSSSRTKAPFVVINCAALRNELLESDLFGHEKGAFTSAIAQKKGKFEIADGGTLFLDEVAELAPDLQVKLLRVLQEREFERVGGIRPLKVDVRVIAATDRDLEGAIREGRFRHELYYRLNVVSVESPPLRQRREDIAVLANYFVARYATRCKRRLGGISPEAEAALQLYDWPGNVRELQNAIERAVVLGESDMIQPEDLPEDIVQARAPSSESSVGFHAKVRESKRRIIQSALDQAGGNHAEAARILGINRTYLHRLIRNLDL